MHQKTKMGRIFLDSGFYSLIITLNLNFGQQQDVFGKTIDIAQTPKKSPIDLPEPPPAEAPLPEREKAREEDLKRLKLHREQREHKENPPVPAPKVFEQKLKKDTEKPHPMRLQIAASLIYPFVSTYGGDRKKYQAEPSAAFHSYFRLGSDQDVSRNQLWLGLRTIFLNGSGIYKDTAGRFGFLYFGPMIGIGNFYSADSAQDDAEKASKNNEENDSSQEQGKQAEQKPSLEKPQTGFFAMGGIAAQTRFSSIDEGRTAPDDDLDTRKGIYFDAPGIWAEAGYTRLYYKAFSLNFLSGFQWGKGKVFYYLGIGTGGWY